MNSANKAAFRVIVLLGLVSLFGDITYEGARSVTGPYLLGLGAGAAAVGLVTGIGEFAGYGLRLLSGYVADRLRAYWVLTFAGYAMILAIPALAFAGSWKTAAVLLVIERMGKAVRTPARDAILSHATKQVGRGIGFGLHEALDQVGAFIGPLLFTAVLLLKGSYRDGFMFLWIPGMLALVFLTYAMLKVPSPEKLETTLPTEPKKDSSAIMWSYALFTFFSVAGFAGFQLMSYHFTVKSVVPEVQIPVFYMVAMAVDAVFALVIGRVYDKVGLLSLAVIPLVGIPLPFFAFSTDYTHAAISVVLWGIVMASHETIMRAAIADLTPVEKRGFAYGLFNTVYGLSWLIGSTLMGLLYDVSVSYIILFSVAMELASVAVFFIILKPRAS